jgi:hypothetical protein
VIKSVGNVPRNSQAKAARMLTAPLLTTLWAAGLSFSRCHFERRVPNDPNLPFVFDGEEFSRTLRGCDRGGEGGEGGGRGSEQRESSAKYAKVHTGAKSLYVLGCNLTYSIGGPGATISTPRHG